LTRMKRSAGLPSEIPHPETVDQFLRRYKAVGVPKEYLLSLRNSELRDIAIGHVHMPPGNADDANFMWTSLSKMLDEEETKKYDALLRFGRGRTDIKYIGG
jgi:hypothetical protein